MVKLCFQDQLFPHAQQNCRLHHVEHFFQHSVFTQAVELHQLKIFQNVNVVDHEAKGLAFFISFFHCICFLLSSSDVDWSFSHLFHFDTN